MKKTILTISLFAAMSLSLTACGKNEESKKETTTEATTEAATETDISSSDSSDTANSDSTEYKSTDGWTISYKPSLFTVNESSEGTSFVYTGESAGTSMLTISYIKDKQPEEVLSEITGTWGDDIQEDITRTESFLPGTTDKLGFWRTYQGQCLIAGEYNGGVILFDIYARLGDGGESSTVNDALSEVLNTITYDNFEAQTMYDYVPGTYKSTYTEEIDGTTVEQERSIILNEDHTGKMIFQDEVDILWYSHEIVTTDGTNTYEYTIEGDDLMINLNDEWITFTK